jgi:hypothetical protein
MTVMQQAVEHGADRGDIAEQFAPVLDRPIYDVSNVLQRS